MTIALYGIPNCDTVKKARTWLDARGIGYAFHDYKKEGADPAKLEEWIAAKGLETVLNKRGTTYRKLSDAEKADAADERKAIALLAANPSMIKRPIAESGDTVLVGFGVAEWEALFG